MGLFHNSKKPCPVCGRPTPRLLAAKVEGVPLCGDCGRRLCMERALRDALTLDGLQAYFLWRGRNDAEKEAFAPTCQVDLGWGGCNVTFDETNGLFLFAEGGNDLLYHAAEVTAVTVREDDTILFSGSAAGYANCESRVCDTVRSIAPQAAANAAALRAYREEKRRYDAEKRRIEAEHRRREEDERKRDPHARPERRRPEPPQMPPPPLEPPLQAFPQPLRGWSVELTLNHPYWSVLKSRINAPAWNEREPDCAQYVEDYGERMGRITACVNCFMRVCFPQAEALDADPSKTPAAAEAARPAAVSDDAIAEIKKYKALLDAGVITEEEFSAKKRRLMGI